MKFIWHLRKSQENWRKHKVSFDEAMTIFNDPLSATVPDPDHSIYESRFVTIGVSSIGRLVVVCYTERAEVVRIISARTATSNERQQYEG